MMIVSGLAPAEFWERNVLCSRGISRSSSDVSDCSFLQDCIIYNFKITFFCLHASYIHFIGFFFVFRVGFVLFRYCTSRRRNCKVHWEVHGSSVRLLFFIFLLTRWGGFFIFYRVSRSSHFSQKWSSSKPLLAVRVPHAPCHGCRNPVSANSPASLAGTKNGMHNVIPALVTVCASYYVS